MCHFDQMMTTATIRPNSYPDHLWQTNQKRFCKDDFIFRFLLAIHFYVTFLLLLFIFIYIFLCFLVWWIRWHWPVPYQMKCKKKCVCIFSSSPYLSCPLLVWSDKTLSCSSVCASSLKGVVYSWTSRGTNTVCYYESSSANCYCSL